MSRTSLNGPDPDRAAESCVICLCRAKQAQFSDLLPEIEKTWRDGASDAVVKYFPWDQKYDKMLRPGPYRGICGDASSLGIIAPSTAGGLDGLCWNDIAGLPDQPAATMPSLDTTTVLPPGLRHRP